MFCLQILYIQESSKWSAKRINKTLVPAQLFKLCNLLILEIIGKLKLLIADPYTLAQLGKLYCWVA